MSALSTVLVTILLLLVVVMIFNLIIFVHELGHFLAARWRGLRVDRFQIWFGKPIWKKTIGGVQYGLGSLPFGGFVSIPQMAPMEAIEGGTLSEEPLPAASPLDKIIVAFAGPFFSVLLAFACALVVWKIGKSRDVIPTQEIGYVTPGSPAEKAGLKAGDTITAIDGTPVEGFFGPLNSIFSSIVLSRGDQIHFTVKRPGEDKPLEITSGFDVPESKWWQRRGLRQVGIAPTAARIELGPATAGNSPAAKAGLKEGDTLVSLDGKHFQTSTGALDYLNSAIGREVMFTVKRDGKEISLPVTAVQRLSPPNLKPKYGVAIYGVPETDTSVVHPGPLTQLKDSALMMWTTVTRLFSPKSNIGIDHLSGPIGIGRVLFNLLQTEYPLSSILYFMVIFNVNLAVINMLPFPVLDGGHITLSALEWVARRPIKVRVLEVLQTSFAMLIFGLFLFICSKDASDFFGGSKQQEIVFPN